MLSCLLIYLGSVGLLFPYLCHQNHHTLMGVWEQYKFGLKVKLPDKF